ncbi:MAG TPA: hypothetical protein QF641_00890 [Candidatus Thalassarchaeaceae archaeon]|nr:hypothetical protein [Candidatus Thalassarchaeaceae archaeon]
MGFGRAVLFALLATVPGVILALVGWAVSGSPEEWNHTMWLSCYAPFFGCVIAGFMIGLRGGGEYGMEG